jgi:hypothetical protein
MDSTGSRCGPDAYCNEHHNYLSISIKGKRKTELASMLCAHAIKTYGGVRIQVHAYLASVLDGNESAALPQRK